jgi:ankyrin repeat protein
MHCPTYTGNFEMAKRLIELGCTNFDSYPYLDEEEVGLSPMHCAAQNGYADIVELLLRSGSGAQYVSAGDHGDGTPLELAISSRRYKVVDVLIKWDNRMLNTPNVYGRYLLERAIQKGDNQIIEQLINAGCDTTIADLIQDKYKETFRERIRAYSFGSLTQKLVCAAPSEQLIKNVYDAARDGDIEKIQQLVEQSNGHVIDTFWIGVTPLAIAAKNGHLTVVKGLLKMGSKALGIPCLKAKLWNGWMPIHFAASEGHLEIIKQIVSFDAKYVDIQVNHAIQSTPMHIAASKGHFDVIKLLVEMGSTSLDTRDGYNQRPILLAHHKKHTETVDVLHKFGASYLKLGSDCDLDDYYDGGY